MADYPLNLLLLQAFTGLALGAVYVLLATGLSLIFGLLTVVNFAHGAFFMVGAYAGLFLFGITQGQVAGFASLGSWGSFLGAVLATAAFIWRINTAKEPFVSPALFRIPLYVTALVIGFFTMFANLAALVLVPLLVVEASGLAPACLIAQ